MRTIPRWPASPYMIVIPSTSTLSARDPDQSAITKPMEMISKRPPESTSSRVGSMIEPTASSVRAWLARAST